ncbi:Acetyl-CoA carboxylase [Eumeta japonica]|uniref:Acetyl-CoA carboxylase n=1 Tax=Eumeta variegata TaxID=151549 RepID=A0A4C2AC54_EUMVA|nr:Acetyl-CoA carboxylase [Eumeta japonica]
MHLYLGRAKVSKGQEVTDFRFFIRSIIRHSDLITKEASFEYLQNEGERVLLESMDELEVAFHPLCQTGARIGLAEEIKAMFKVAWEDPEEPEKGFKYLYLTTEDYSKVSNLNSVRTVLIDDEGEPRYKITDIIGKDDGLGVENLRYAGLIAGETSQAYDEIVTISMVTCRTIVDSDRINRPIDFMPTKSPYDPRWMLAGRVNPANGNEWENGFFDRDSWSEIMAPWAKTVVTGRARLGGIPVGVIAVETRTVEVEMPADPANLDSEAKTLQQAGQVWYPDSSYKTSQAIKDFGREELPLIIFANWRGFSSGMKDMYDQIVKFGAYIVDSLREYKKPILVYLPPNAELRGGAWAVLDSLINPRYMESYADPEARAGVLEAEGIVEIKYREKDLVKTIHRLDPTTKEKLVLLASTSSLLEDSFIKKLLKPEDNLSVGQAKEMLRRWLVEDKGTTVDCPEVTLDAVVGLCQNLTSVNRGVVVRTLAQLQLNEEAGTTVNQG